MLDSAAYHGLACLRPRMYVVAGKEAIQPGEKYLSAPGSESCHVPHFDQHGRQGWPGSVAYKQMLVNV